MSSAHGWPRDPVRHDHPDGARDQVADRRKITFDRILTVDGIDSSGDPLTEVRADIYLLSGSRRLR